MGDWIKENKFETGLLVVVLIVAGIAYSMAGKWGTAYEVEVENYGAAKRKKQDYEGRKPFPTADNRDEFAEEVEDYRKVVNGLQGKLLAYRPKEFKQIAPSDFTDRLNAAVTELSTRYLGDEIDFPAEKWRLGFEVYTDTPPRDGATAFLAYQLEAHKWLFSTLADAGPSALLNVVRPELPVEKGESMTPTPGKKKSGPRPPSGPSLPFYSLPVELTFRAPEPAVRKFLSNLVGGKNHFFVINTLRIQNEKKGDPPKKDDVKFDDKAATGGAASPFGTSFDLVVPDEEPGDADTPAPEGDDAPAPEGGDVPDPFPTDPFPGGGGGGEEGGGERILGQVLGNEEVNVFLKLDLILFKEGGNLP